MSKFKVEFDNLDVGWVTLTIREQSRVVIIQASYIYNSFHQLVDALYKLKLSEGEAIAVWQCEPMEYELCFTREEETIALDILCFPDSSRSVFQRNIVLSTTGTYEEICLPFWRALRSLQGRYSEAEIEERWQRTFPTREMKMLTSALGK